MRISGGTLRGRTVLCPPGTIRPAMDRMRESMFSILGDLTGHSFLDLFSGSGLVGLEAWSRGARPVVLVEKDRGKERTIRENLVKLDPPPVLRIQPVERFIQRNREEFNILYLDPPFDYRHKVDILTRIAVSPATVASTIVLIHAPTAEDLPERVTPPVPREGLLQRYDERTYGGSRLTFYRFEQRTPGA